jgi:hypothetical protein
VVSVSVAEILDDWEKQADKFPSILGCIRIVDRKVTRVELWSGRETPVDALTGLDASPTMKSVAPLCRCVPKRVARDGDEFAVRGTKAGKILFRIARH